MSDIGVKVNCKVRPMKDGKLSPGYDGLAHILRAKYDENFTAVYGSVSVACTGDEFYALLNDYKACLHFEDGRLVEVKLMASQDSRMAVIGEEVIGSEWNLIYFVATTNLRES